MYAPWPNDMVPNVIPPSHDDHLPLYFCPSLIWVHQPQVLDTIGSATVFDIIVLYANSKRFPKSQHMVVP